jgi:hypothetical protein
MNGHGNETKFDVLLAEYLESRAMAHLKRYSKILQKVERVVNPLLKELKKRDKRFNFEPMSPDGFFRVRQRNVLEVFLVFKKIDASKVSFIEMDSPTGVAFVSSKAAKLQNSWLDLMEGGSNQGFFLSSERIREYLCSFLQDFSREKGILDPKVWFHCTNNDEDGLVLSISYEGEQLFVHLIPTIFLKAVWPDCASMWKKVLFRWPEDYIRCKIVNEGIHLTCQPVKASLQHSSMLWQISFLIGEKILLNTANVGCRNKCLQIAKTILEDSLCYPEGLMPYHLETITLHLNSMISSPSLWQDANLSPRFLDLMSSLQKSLSQASCAHFFAPSIQLFDDVSPNLLKNLAARVKRILDKPEEFFQTFYHETLTTQF